MAKKTSKIPSVVYEKKTTKEHFDAMPVKTMPKVIKTQPNTTASNNDNKKV